MTTELSMAPQLEILRKGDDWKLPNYNDRITDLFSELAKMHGSAAKWLPQTGYLITEDLSEAAKNFPYEEWRDQALKETGHV